MLSASFMPRQTGFITSEVGNINWIYPAYIGCFQQGPAGESRLGNAELQPSRDISQTFKQQWTALWIAAGFGLVQRRVEVVQGNQPLLDIGAGTHLLRAAEKHAHFAGAHIPEQRQLGSCGAVRLFH